MNNDEIINKAILELKEAPEIYMQFNDFSFMSGLEWGDDKFQKIRYLLIRTDAFETHSDRAIRLSKIGLEITNNGKDWFEHKKSLKPKTDKAKWVGIVITALSLIWNIYQGINNNKLTEDNNKLVKQIEILKKNKG
jgi:hypothetical protein